MPLVLPGNEVSLNQPGSRFHRHHHLNGYAALLVSGSCHEVGDSGRFHARAGDVLIHEGFHGHADRIGARGARFINIPLKSSLDAKSGKVADLDLVVRAFERDGKEGVAAFHEQFRLTVYAAADWPDLLAEELAEGRVVRLDNWARSKGVHPGSVSRAFRLAYGITPKRFRLEQLAARAARRLVGSAESLAIVAADAGFADQSHMTRAFAELFRITPASLRRL
jgi:AraC-like DNA-binding protein